MMKSIFTAAGALLIAASVSGDQSAFPIPSRAARTMHRSRGGICLRRCHRVGQEFAEHRPRPAGSMPETLRAIRWRCTRGLDIQSLRTGERRHLRRRKPPGRVKVMRARAAGRAQRSRCSPPVCRGRSGSRSPPDRSAHVYVATPTPSCAFRFKFGESEARGRPENDLRRFRRAPARARHWSRDIVFSGDGRKMYVSVGSLTTSTTRPPGERIARRCWSSIRTGGPPRLCVRYPQRRGSRPSQTGQIWVSVNGATRSANLVPD